MATADSAQSPDISSYLACLYPKENVENLLERLELLLAIHQDRQSSPRKRSLWNEKTSLLITYPDMIKHKGEIPLFTLERFLDDYLTDCIEGVHILPFYPYTSDEGFSVIDYKRVHPDFGEWEDVERIAKKFRLMVDLVLNHVSRCSNWFQEYLSGIAPYKNFFIEVDPQTDLSSVVRPRTSPLLTKVQTVFGERYVWTTFSPDQVDLNFKSPDVLLAMIEILLFYVARGAQIIRLDAIAYVWKELGTSCVNLPQAHLIVKVFRQILDKIAPGTILLTETNLPHKENISYFGNSDEAHMVYQFSLPPLLLYSLHTGKTDVLRNWAKSVSFCPPGCTYLNFTASHDGIGVRPLEDLVSEKEIQSLVDLTYKLGGLVSFRKTPQGEKPYELNITYFDALKDLNHPDDLDLQIKRFLCTQIIMLGLKGVPAIYFHSLIGSSNYYEGVHKFKQNRSINRQRLDDSELRAKLADPASKESIVYHKFKKILKIRRAHLSFHPDAYQQVLDLGDGLFGFMRMSLDEQEKIYCLHNLTGLPKQCNLPESLQNKAVLDLLFPVSEQELERDKNAITLQPYQCAWLVG